MKKITNILNVQNRNILIYLFSDLLAKALPFVFIPLFTKYLTPEQYGNISLFNVGVEVFIIIIIMGGNSYFKIEYNNFKEPISALYNIIINVAMIFFICFIISWGFYFYIHSSYLFSILPVIILCSFLQSIFYLYISYYQCKEKAIVVGAMNLFFSITNTLLMVILLVFFDMKEISRYISLGFALFFSVLIVGYILGRSNKSKVSAKINMPLVRFGFGVLPHAISWWARSGIERLLIGWYLSVSTLGLYSLAMQLTSLMPLFCNAVNQALIPRIVRSLKAEDKKEAKNILFKATLGIMIVCLLSSIALPFLLKYFLNHRYFEALVYLPYMIIAFVFQSVIILFGNVLYYYKHVTYLSMVTFCTSALHICLTLAILNYKPSVYSVIISSTITFILAALLIFKRAMLLMRGGNDS